MMNSDLQESPMENTPVHVTKEIPLWGIITVLGAFAAQAVALYYSNQNQAAALVAYGQQLATVGSDVKSIGNELNNSKVRGAETAFRLDDLTRRLAAVELVLQAPPTTRSSNGR